MARGANYYMNLARQAARAAGIDEDIFLRQIRQESGFNPNARSSAGALGIAQIMPGTARGWGVNPMDPRAALYAAARADAKYLRSYGGDWAKVLTAYNAGPGRVGKPLYAETRAYINAILGGSPVRAAMGGGARLPVAAPVASGDSDALNFIFAGSPFEGMIPQGAPPSQPAAAGYSSGPPPSGPRNWRWLQQQGQRLFGLQNDPGASQTTGGRHSANSRHYSGLAVDFGDARNSRDKLNAWYQWALKNRGKYGFNEVLDEGDHIHVSF